MGNNSSAPVALPAPTHTFTPSFFTISEPHRSLSVSPLEPNTLVSVTKTSSHGVSSTQTEEHCFWDWDKETTTCFPTITADVPTPLTPTGGYETSEASFTFPIYSYTCTDLYCVESVASKYGYSLCLPTSTTKLWPPAETWSSYDASTTDKSETTSTTCGPFNWDDCPVPTPDPSSPTDDWPTITWDWPPETTSDCDTTDTSTTSSSSTEDCGFDIDCWTSIHYNTVKRSRLSSSTTSSKHSYSYRSTSTSTKSTRTSTISECDFWDEDCTPSATPELTTWGWSTRPWSGRPVSTKVPLPHQSTEAKE
ncbi:hypothetical protein F5X98DRAFT_380132 [Xylaria grammica]|nr:hypothetical protein F5X98DRAFT_380132 [Xylaria grammica]